MTPEQIRFAAAKLLADLAGLPERGMRIVVLVERLGALSDGDLVETLHCMIETTTLTPGDSLGFVMTLVEGEAFAQRIGYKRVSVIYRLAIEAGYESLARLFLRGAPKEPAGELRPAIHFPEVEGKTLGERKNLARRGKWQMVTRLLYDTDPEVIRNLLLNPRVRETEVVKIAARRPNSAEILRMIAESARWCTRLSVRRAIVFNPYSPINISLALATSFGREDLRAVAADGVLHPWLREHARQILTDRRPSQEDEAEEPEAEAADATARAAERAPAGTAGDPPLAPPPARPDPECDD